MTDAVGTRHATTPEIVELPERHAAVVGIDGRLDELPRLMGEAFGLSAETIGESGAVIAGPPFARYYGFGERIQAEAGFPFSGTLVPTDRVRETILPGGRLVTTTHVGSYEELTQAWDRAAAWMREHALTSTGAPWECYLTGPDEPGPPITEIFWPLDDHRPSPRPRAGCPRTGTP
ncbi:MAG TPA: GyrI-like domain-containing protein [Candidatus Limnocylindrales bacterium]